MRDYYSIFVEKKVINVTVYEVSKVSKAENNPFDTFDTKQTGINPDNFFSGIFRENEINGFNLFVDSYNSAVDRVLSSDELKEAFETICEEQKSILVICGNMSDEDAESYVRKPENLRRAVLSAVN